MKKIFTIIFAALLFAVSFNASAIKAYPYPIQVTQPDGSVITIQMHGDEFHHWTTDINGQTISRADDGFFRPVAGGRSNAMAAAEEMRRTAMQKVSSSITTGKDNHFLVLLVEFPDRSFKVQDAQQAFSDLLNKQGYNANNGTGSVRDYYSDNSAGAFNPVFDVLGPFKVKKSYTYYGGNDADGNDAHPAELLRDVCVSFDSKIDFSQYDIDNDGMVDNIFFYYAGYSEAEYAGDDYIWPHKYDLRAEYNLRLDGKLLGPYACTAELKGRTGTNMCGIGTFCHEFGHVLGLPDFYDTDYESNGEGYGMGPFSLMADGSYNNSGITPPALTGIERKIIGWMKDFTEWKEAGNKTVPDIMDNEAFMTSTTNPGEYFVYESRGGNKWDSKIGAQGLLIYHVDQSTNRVGGKTAASLWNSGEINAYASHQCCMIMPAVKNFRSVSQITYPGAGKVTKFDSNSSSPMLDWAGNPTGMAISNIAYSAGTVTLTFGMESGKSVTGTVKDKDGNPVIGATVMLVPASPTSKVPVLKPRALSLEPRVKPMNKAAAGSKYTATIGSDGKFAFDLEGVSDVDFTLTVLCYGYYDYTNAFKLVVGELQRDIVLQKKETLAEETEYERFGWDVDYATGLGAAVVAAIRYPAEELADAVGAQLNSVGFYLNECNVTDLRIIVDFGDETVLNGKISEPVFGGVTYDISDFDLRIPEGKDVYVGIYVDAAETDYPFVYNSQVVDNNGFYVRSLSDHNWEDFSDEGSLAIWFTLLPDRSQPYVYGYNGIANPKDGQYAAGEEFSLDIVESSMKYDSVEWFFDGAAVDGTPVELTAGEHEVKAILHFNSGRTEIIVQIINAE